MDVKAVVNEHSLSSLHCFHSFDLFLLTVITFPFLCSHLDHIGALPYFTEVCGYDGPIYMTVS